MLLKNFKQLSNIILTKLYNLYYKIVLPSRNQNYHISPKPTYISQFIDLYPPTLQLNTPLTNKKHIKDFGATDSKEFSFWAWRVCGIACVKMIIDSYKDSANAKNLMELTNEGISLGGYIVYENNKFVDKGWFHHALVKLLQNHGFKSRKKRWQTIESVAIDILQNKFVILSINVPFRSHIYTDGSFQAKPDAPSGGHLILATGVKLNGKKVEAIYAHDPRGLTNYQQDTYIPKNVFNKIFTGRTIVANK